MKQIAKFFLFGLFITYSQITAAQPPIYWVHGLGGTPAKWNAYAPFFEDQLSSLNSTNSIRPAYNSRFGAVNGANEAIALMNPQQVEGIAIGHSMGGLVTREIARDPSRGGTTSSMPRFKAFVTIASPHSGAFIGNSIDNGNVDKMITAGLFRVTAGPSASILSIFNFPTNPTVVTSFGTLIASDVINEIKNTNTTVAGAVQIREGHSELIALNTAPSPNMPKVGLQAEEQEPILWRVVSHVTDDPGELHAVDTYGRRDDKFPVGTNTLANIYYNAAGIAALAGTVNAIFMNWGVATKAFIVSGAWLIGATWFDFDANDEWHWIIGAAQKGYWHYFTGRRVHMCDLEKDPQVRAYCYADCADKNDEGCWIEEVISGYGTIRDASDGVVQLGVQKAMPDKLAWNITAGVGAPKPGETDRIGDTGCGHQEARNHPGMKEALIRVFKGEPDFRFERQ